MAGEWIPIDCNLGMKPEVLAIAASTGVTQEVVIGRMVRLWAWAWHVTADGTIGVSLSMLPSVAGGDEAFWEAVQSAGWLEATDSTVTIPGWEERFSNAAKRRLLDARRKSVRRVSAECPHDKRTDCGRAADTLRTRGEEKRKEFSQLDFWKFFRKEWNAGTGKRWTPSKPPAEWDAEERDDEWLSEARQAIARLPLCRYFATPVTLPQFLKPGWLEKIVSGEFDEPPRKNGKASFEDRPPVREFDPATKAALERTRRALETSRAN